MTCRGENLLPYCSLVSWGESRQITNESPALRVVMDGVSRKGLWWSRVLLLASFVVLGLITTKDPSFVMGECLQLEKKVMRSFLMETLVEVNIDGFGFYLMKKGIRKGRVWDQNPS